jgi:hypothetical protein
MVLLGASPHGLHLMSRGAGPQGGAVATCLRTPLTAGGASLHSPGMNLHRCSRCDGPSDWNGRTFENICSDCRADEVDAASDWARDEELLNGEG